MAIKPKNYETLYLVRPDISSEELSVIQDKVTNSITSSEGNISKSEKWADRNLAYPINDFTKGSYYIVEFSALPKVVADIEKHLAFHKTDVLRFITVSVDDEDLITPEASTPEPARESSPLAPKPQAAPETPPEPTPEPEPAPAPEAEAPAEPVPPSEAETTPETEPEPQKGTEPAAETEPAQETETTTVSDTSGFTAAPPLSEESSSDEDKKEGGES